LTLVRRLVELHQGTVQAFSDGLGRGSEFVVRLPVHHPQGWPGHNGELHPAKESPPCFQYRVLVVDDNVDVANSLAVLLRLNGHEVETAYNGFDALKVAEIFAPQAIFLDIGLPGLDGYQIAQRLRAQSITRESLLVAVSGYGQEEDRQRSVQSGFNFHLTKPVEYSALEETLLSLAEKRKATLKASRRTKVSVGQSDG
jgi:two-component system, chemotaxis family, CheB/CheR fusion protein